jgi:hypothetical protein
MVPGTRTAYIVAKNKERKRQRRAQLIEMLGGRCVRCGTTDDLEFDHIDPATKRFVVCSNLARPWNDLVEEALRCQLLCRSCHRAKGAEDRPGPPHGIYRYSDLGCRCEVCRATNAAKSAKRRARRKASVNDDFTVTSRSAEGRDVGIDPGSGSDTQAQSGNGLGYGSSTATGVARKARSTSWRPSARCW